MEELIKLVAQKTGISAAQAKGAVETVFGYLKQNLPEPLGSQLEGLLGQANAMNQVDDVLKNLGGLGGLGDLGALGDLLGGKK